MGKPVLAASLIASCVLMTGCISPITSFNGYVADDALPVEMEPGIDTRTSVLARLGSPSTKSVFDDNTWYYMTTQKGQLAFYRPRVTNRTIIGIRFNDTDVVEEVLEYDITDGEVINYASRETPTLGRQLTFLEQLLGSIGTVALPQTDESTPGNPTGR
ncbi:MAG: outer membrane protein assembly factor BamE [Pseudomonadota bacterium]